MESTGSYPCEHVELCRSGTVTAFMLCVEAISWYYLQEFFFRAVIMHPSVENKKRYRTIESIITAIVFPSG